METIQNYTLYRVIGNGAFGVVYLAKDYNNNEFAIKKIDTRSISDVHRKLIKTEIQVLTTVKVPSVIQLYEIIETDQAIYIVTEFCKGGDLESVLLKNKVIPKSTRKRWIKLLILALIELKSLNIIHRDLKKANILLTDPDFDQAELKICDFGLSKILSPGSVAQSRVGTPVNMAPEVLDGKVYSFKADVWSLGILCYEILLRIPPFTCYELTELLELQKNPERFLNNEKLSHVEKSFLSLMIIHDENSRAGYEDLLNHEFFAEKPEIKEDSEESEEYEVLEIEGGSKSSPKSESFQILGSKNSSQELKILESNEKMIFNHNSWTDHSDIENYYQRVNMIIEVRLEKLNFFQEILTTVWEDTQLIFVIKKYLESSFRSLLLSIELFEERCPGQFERFRSQKSLFLSALKEVQEDLSLITQQFAITESVVLEALVNKICLLNEEKNLNYSKFLSLAGHVLYPSSAVISECYYSAWSS